jgi:glycosyltransferase involved in cell wall biosynthesis
VITVVMPSYLGDYPGAAANRDVKLRRAINSFLNQGIGKLIVVADGCQQTIDIVREFKHESISSILVEKQPIFSGYPRQVGINFATTDWICYLDSDDEFLPGHLKAICDNIDDNVDWFYYNDILVNQYRDCIPAFTRIGTSCIVHKKDTSARWPTGYGHDWGFITQLGNRFKKIEGPGYVVHHIPGVVDN